jgi:transcriptional regulator with PAS, ATPase and Fis domain
MSATLAGERREIVTDLPFPHEPPPGVLPRFGRLVGGSPAMQRVFDLIRHAAASEANLIITGESGTGKELVARTIHAMSRRRSGPFVPVNCGAIPETLMESEFFGYRKGAFSGAVFDKHGFLDLADRGTLFLDELGELGPAMQVKLLRAIDGGGFTPLGGLEVKQPDLRVMAATNRNLAEMLISGGIREDFYYRVHVIPIELPPLRERREDIPLLVAHFMAAAGAAPGAPRLAGHHLAALQAHDWPGNVRELQNTVQRFLTLGKIEFAGQRPAPGGVGAVGTAAAEAGSADLGLDGQVERFERQLIREALERHRWRREATAKALRIHRKTLFTKMKKYGLAAAGVDA